MRKLLDSSKFFFEVLDKLRDKVLNVFIVPLWPRKIMPNHLTFARIIISILLFILLFYYKNENSFIIIPLFFIGIMTDLLDGSVARALNKETKLGERLDPIADRLLIIPIAIYSLIDSHRWLLLILIILEIINGMMSVYSESNNIFIKSNIFGKIKMVLHSIVFLAILYFWPKPPNIFFIDILWISITVMIVSIFFKYFEIKSMLRIKI